MATILVAAVSIILVALNVIATRTVALSEAPRKQKIFQFLLTWFAPLIGAILVLYFHHEPQTVQGRPEGDSLFDTFIDSAPFDHKPPGSDGP